jgi:hypothetical protein
MQFGDKFGGTFGTAPAAKTKAAIAAVLQRIQTDPRVAYYLCPATETYDKVVAAHCELNGLDEAQFRKDFEMGLRFEAPAERDD